MLAQLKTSVLVLLVFSVLTGLVYPLAVTGIAQIAFPSQADGSLIQRDGHAIGSELIGQPFDDPKYFWGRPSATAPFPYNAGSSSGSNLAVTNPAQEDAIKQRIAKLRESGVRSDQPIPIDLVTASGSGLDPHLSVAAARCQVPRVARARGMDEAAVMHLVQAATEGRQFGLLGEPRVNVLRLNLTLDEVRSAAPSAATGVPRIWSVHFRAGDDAALAMLSGSGSPEPRTGNGVTQVYTQSNAGQPSKPGQTPKPTQQPKPSAPGTTPAKGAPVATPSGPQKPATK